jgi:two-component system cell cycle response regulator CtrA
MRILLVEDDASTARSIELMLKAENWIVDVTDQGEDGLEIGQLYDYDLILLDLMLPDMDGYEVLRRLRQARVRTPILILSGLAELDAKIKGLGFGADDYVTKPFDRRELVARIQAIVRRSKGHSDSVIRTGKLTVNLDTRSVEVEGQPIHLTGKEYGILELLSLRKGTTLTKEMFLNHLYNGMDEPELKIIDVFICKLRKKLAAAIDGEGPGTAGAFCMGSGCFRNGERPRRIGRDLASRGAGQTSAADQPAARMLPDFCVTR